MSGNPCAWRRGLGVSIVSYGKLKEPGSKKNTSFTAWLPTGSNGLGNLSHGNNYSSEIYLPPAGTTRGIPRATGGFRRSPSSITALR